MRPLRFCAVPAMLLLSILVHSSGAQTRKVNVQRLAWLSGCWVIQAGENQTTERWMRPSGDAILGMVRTVSKGQTIFYESLQILQTDTGIVFTAHPRRGYKVSYKLILVSEREAVFENPHVGFPRRKIYRLEADGSMTVRTEGEEAGREKSQTYAMKREECN